MARVVKKENNAGNKKPLIIGVSVAVLVAVITTIVLLVVFLGNKVEKIDYKSREISYEDLVDLLDVDTNKVDYEEVIYIYVYSSDIESNPKCDLDETAYARLKSLISAERKLYNHYQQEDIAKNKRTAFYTLDTSDDDNEDILNNKQFFEQTEAGFILKVNGQKLSLDDNGTNLKQRFLEIKNILQDIHE